MLGDIALAASNANNGAKLVMLAWLRRESLATAAMLGMALTLLGQLASVIPIAPPLLDLLSLWTRITHGLWRPPLELVGLPLHQDLVAALTAALFMAMIGVGARVSARLGGAPLAPIVLARWLDDMTWPSLLVFAAICMVFLLGHGVSHTDPLVVWGSREWGKYAFACTVAAGYAAGDYVGHGEFHRRLLRLAVLVSLLLAVNYGLLRLIGVV
jgi:hypothetical protein